MREIKFRAWATESKEMIYDVSIDTTHYTEVYCWDDKHEDLEILGDWRKGSMLQYCIPMQYTGLKDKNGKEIYEGDIIKLDGGRQEVVEFKEQVDGYMGSVVALGYNIDWECFEVIGNIYENPELSKDK